MKMNEVIYEKRKELNLTQEQVAERLGVTPPAVHKWEKGASCPDILLLPALARLLKTDLNTLFSFEQELSESEIERLAGEIMQAIQKDGYERGFQMAMEKVREFPTCSALLANVAALLDGALMFRPQTDLQIYDEAIETLYQRALENAGAQVRDSVNQMLIIRYMKRKEYEKAQRLLEELPETTVDKKALTATLYLNQDRKEEAREVLQESLLQYVNGAQSTLTTLMICFMKLGDTKRVRMCGQKIEHLVDEFELWEYGKYMAQYQVAVYEKDRENALLGLRGMLRAMRRPIESHKSPLFGDILREETPQREPDSMKLLRNNLLDALRQGGGLDGEGFLQDDAELAEILRAEEKILKAR